MLTIKQEQKYWRTWSAILRAQGWAHESSVQKDKRRKETHIMCGLKNPDGTARSMKSFGNREFSRWLAATAHLCDEVDIRDRDRENAVWTIERLSAAFEKLLGHDYARALTISFRDTEDLDKFPVEDPLRFMRDEEGNIDPRDKGRMRDLVNLRNTLKNRLGRVIERIRTGEIEPGPDCPKFYDRNQEEIIRCLIDKKPITPRPRMAIRVSSDGTTTAAPQRRKYTLHSGASFQPAQPPNLQHAEEERPMTTRRRKPATVMGPTPVAPSTTVKNYGAQDTAAAPSQARPSGYCMHAVAPPKSMPAPAHNEPGFTILDEGAFTAEPDDNADPY